MLTPTTDSALKAMLETSIHGVVSLAVIGSSTYLAAHHNIDSGTWAAAVGAGIAASGAVSILQGKATNGHIVEEAFALEKLPGGRRHYDPPVERQHREPEAKDPGSG